MLILYTENYKDFQDKKCNQKHKCIIIYFNVNLSVQKLHSLKQLQYRYGINLRNVSYSNCVDVNVQALFWRISNRTGTKNGRD